MHTVFHTGFILFFFYKMKSCQALPPDKEDDFVISLSPSIIINL